MTRKPRATTRSRSLRSDSPGLAEYDSQAIRWQRSEPLTLSDLVGRTELLRRVSVYGHVSTLVDLGCGEGYLTRRLRSQADKVVGVDVSRGMINLARQQEQENPLGIEYIVDDVRNLLSIESSSVDVCTSGYVTNYLDRSGLETFYGELGRILRKDGRFALVLPHPVLYLTQDPSELSITAAEDAEFDYSRSRGRIFKGTINTLNGTTLTISVTHTTLEDHFSGIRQAGLLVSHLHEPSLTKEQAAHHPQFRGFVGRVHFLVIEGLKSA